MIVPIIIFFVNNLTYSLILFKHNLMNNNKSVLNYTDRYYTVKGKRCDKIVSHTIKRPGTVFGHKTDSRIRWFATDVRRVEIRSMIRHHQSEHRLDVD